MSHVALFIIGNILLFTPIAWIFYVLGLSFRELLTLALLMTSIILAVMCLEASSFLSSSSAALPACLDGVAIETNGSTGGAYTCTTPCP